MGGGGSINYTMIFESSDWLTKNLGHNQAYWDESKKELAKSFHLRNPQKNLTAVDIHDKKKLEDSDFIVNEDNEGHIPVYSDGKNKQIHIFPTQFNEFGQRTHSGVSLLNWYENPRLDFMTQQRVTQLHLETKDKGQQCTAIAVLNLVKGELKTYQLGKNTKLLLCAGAGTPQLLYEHREKLNNFEIGKHVNDHILLPFGIYLLKKDLQVTLKDQYISMFATTEEFSSEKGEEEPTICNFDFFSGQLDTVLYFLSHLFLAFWVPNGLKSWMIRNQRIFECLKLVSRSLITALNFLDDILWSIFHPSKIGKHKWNLISAVVKFNIAREGYYEPADNHKIFAKKKQKIYKIILRCFDDKSLENDPDFRIAKAVLAKQIPLLDSLGAKPHPVFQFLIRLLTRMPYNAEQVHDYVNHYSRNDLLTQQHLSGG